MTKTKLNEIEEIIQKYKKGQMIIVTDDEDRENEGDFMISSEKITTEDVAFMAINGRGLICISIEESLAEKLNLLLMTKGNNSQYSTAFTISVDAKNDTTTGISAGDRYKTIKTIIDGESQPDDLLKPGHMFPLIAAGNGLKERMGHTEAAVDLAKISGHFPSGVICEIMSDDGTMTREDDLKVLAAQYNLPILTIKDLKEYLQMSEESIATSMPTDYGDFNLFHFPSDISEQMPHIALVHKNLDRKETTNVRIHSECLTGEIFCRRMQY